MAEKKNTEKKNVLKEESQPKENQNVTKKESKKEPKKEGENLSPSIKISSVWAFLRSEKFKRIVGLFLILFSIYCLIAFTSYLFSWTVDDNIFNKSLTDIWFDTSVKVENWMGRIGALISHLFIKKWFGVSSFLFIAIFFNYGVKLFLSVTLLPVKRTFYILFFFIVWTSMALGYLFRTEELSILGGIFGYQTTTWINGIIGVAGTFLLLSFILLSFFMLVLNKKIHFNFPIFGKKYFNELDEEEVVEETTSEKQNTLQSEEFLLQNNLISVEKEEENQSSEIELIRKNEDKILIQTEEVKEKQIENKVVKDELELSITNTSNEFLIKNLTNQNVETAPENIETLENNKEILTEEKFASNDFEIINTLENNTDELVEVEQVSPKDIFQTPEDISKQLVEKYGEYDPTLDLPGYKYPTVDLLNDYTQSATSLEEIKKELESNKNKIVETLANYSIQIDKISATVGPTVTLYEIIPAPGIRISKIKNLEDDIALSLSALKIRIIAPIPGKGTIGIEVPNLKPQMVSIKSIFSTELFANCNYDLPIAIGKTISNEIFITDLTKMPHLLMAGATGQGKSVGLNAVLASILFKKHPAQVKFVLVDPKKVELSLFSHIERHFLAKLPDSEEAIITDTKKVVRTLNSLCIEMDQRYDLLKNASVRTIKEYNAKFVNRKLNPDNGHRYLPYIVVVVDEFADLIMTAGKEVEMPLARLAQLARAIGIHLVIATQRPSVNIITGIIKANFPARIAFRVTSKIDSRTILDAGGADQLIGRGDMLLSNGSDLIRLQCAFIDTPEIEKVTEFIGLQRAYPTAFALPECNDDGSLEVTNQGTLDNASKDPLFEDAARVMVSTQQGSTSMLQRRMKLGFNRAGRIVDQLEAAGILGPLEGTKREVKIKSEQDLEQLLKSFK